MKTKINLFALLVGFFAFAFTTANDPEYTVDTQQSKLSWIGRKVSGEHSGNISISDGKLNWNGKGLTGGSFEIDMASITNTDISDETYNQQLVGHLKSDDFFATDKFPKASFVITNVKPLANNQSQITGNLSLKGVSKKVQFPASVQVQGNKLIATAKILVDRTQYNIRYGSGSFFDNLGDKAIDNEFELNVALVASK